MSDNFENKNNEPLPPKNLHTNVALHDQPESAPAPVIKNKKRTILIVSIIGIIVLACAIGGTIFGVLYMQGNAPATTSAAEATNVFPDGTLVNNISIAGETKVDALTTLQAANLTPTNYSVTLVEGDHTTTLTGDQIPMDMGLESAVNNAYDYVWNCTMKEHNARVNTLKKTPKDFAETPTLESDKLTQTLTDATADWNTPKQEPKITGVSGGTVQVTGGVDGQTVDINQLTTDVTTLLQTQNTGTVTVQMIPDPCSHTAEDLQANMKPLGTFSTHSTNNANGNLNMTIASRAVNGTVLQPGEEFSFLGVTGDSTNASQGYKEAGAIDQGELIQAYGGGICQVSSTLYGAALRSNMTITVRYNHSFPSSYVPLGLDATVSYPTTDFKFKNDSTYPVYIAESMSGKTVTATLYGYQSPDYDKIEVSSWKTATIPEPESVYTTDKSLSPDPDPMSKKVLKSPGRTGYRAAAQRKFFLNGVLVKTEDLSASYYVATAAVYIIPPQGDAPAPAPAPDDNTSSSVINH